ncbi:GNAT family N-acetyltransferase [Antarcticirhabdus aurantiaca]|uniref:GNAT family N-acetyltransferase n=1 Tax=Antarcticirhabdus aurantiaca TaxID=2606717 RepID=A0ACD4NP97_9HYPH|nr:GNAT family N-acetyltransferase [Antarcticirhabdus aurantiaca]WAJ28643.1 GNAT family N-acetyltransferase [Jeongeuplla avenae]
MGDERFAFSIRAAEPRDAEGLAALSNLPGYRFGTLRLPFDTAEAVRKRVLGENPNMTLIVAEAENRIVGSASLQRYTGRRAHVGAIGMGVHDDHLRRGIGRALLSALTELADDWLGLVRLELEVNTDNAAAIALYEAAGFEIEGRARQSILRQGVLVDTFAMARLRPAPGPVSSSA